MIKLIRSQSNPILQPIKTNNWENRAVFNPGVIYHENKFYMLYRAIGSEGNYMSRFGLATSHDGFNFQRIHDTPVLYPNEDYEEGAIEDCRLNKIEDEIYLTYTAVSEQLMKNGKWLKPPNVQINLETGLMKTKDLVNFERLGLISTPGSDDKDTVLFPEKINGKYVKFHRPHRWSKKSLETPIEEIFPTEIPFSKDQLPEKPSVWMATSPDLINWGDHKLILNSVESNEKIGSGAPPLKTKDGWLLFYHHVENNHKDTSSLYTYSTRVALFDLNDPSRLIAKIPYDVLAPEEWYEKEGDVNNVVFPTGLVEKNGTLFVYYGAADKYCAVATIRLEEVLSELQKNKIR